MQSNPYEPYQPLSRAVPANFGQTPPPAAPTVATMPPTLHDARRFFDRSPNRFNKPSERGSGPAAPDLLPPVSRAAPLKPEPENFLSPPELIRNLTSAAQQAADRFRNDRVAQAGWRTMWGQSEPVKKANEPRYTLSPGEMRAAGIHRVVKNGSSYSSDPFAKAGDGNEVRYYSSGSQRLDRHLPAGVPKLSDTQAVIRDIDAKDPRAAVRAYHEAENKAPQRTAEQMMQLAYHDLNRYGTPEQRDYAARVRRQAAIEAGAPLTREEKLSEAMREVEMNRVMAERNKAYVDLEKSRAEAAIAQQGNFANNATAAFEREAPVRKYRETYMGNNPGASEFDATLEALKWAKAQGIDPRGLPMFEAIEASLAREIRDRAQAELAMQTFYTDGTVIPVPDLANIGRPKELDGWDKFDRFVGRAMPSPFAAHRYKAGAASYVDLPAGEGRTVRSFLGPQQTEALEQLYGVLNRIDEKEKR